MVFMSVSETVSSFEPVSQTLKRAGSQRSCFMKRKVRLRNWGQEPRAGLQSWTLSNPADSRPPQPARDPQLGGDAVLAPLAQFGQEHVCWFILQSPSFTLISILCPCSYFHNKRVQRNQENFLSQLINLVNCLIFTILSPHRSRTSHLQCMSQNLLSCD